MSIISSIEMPAVCLNISPKLLVYIVDKKFNHYNDSNFRKFCMKIKMRLNYVCVVIPKNTASIPLISVFVKENKYNC